MRERSDRSVPSVDGRTSCALLQGRHVRACSAGQPDGGGRLDLGSARLRNAHAESNRADRGRATIRLSKLGSTSGVAAEILMHRVAGDLETGTDDVFLPIGRHLLPDDGDRRERMDVRLLRVSTLIGRMDGRPGCKEIDRLRRQRKG